MTKKLIFGCPVGLHKRFLSTTNEGRSHRSIYNIRERNYELFLFVVLVNSAL
jgi:hypothetical protein